MSDTPFGSLDREGNMISTPHGEPMAYGRFFVNPDELDNFEAWGWRMVRTVNKTMIVIERMPHEVRFRRRRKGHTGMAGKRPRQVIIDDV